MNQPLFSILKNTPLQIQQNTLSHTFVLCGQEQSGKSSIISKLCSTPIQEQSGLIYTCHKTNIAGQSAIIQYFEVSGQPFKQLVSLPLNYSNHTNLTFVLVLDLSEDPTQILSVLDREFEYIRQAQEEKLVKIIPIDNFKDLEQKSYNKIQNHQDRARIRYTYIPICVVGWKYDQFTKGLDLETRKWICRGIRYLSLMNNASVVFGNDGDYNQTKSILYTHIRPHAIYFTDHTKAIAISQLQDNVEEIGLPPTGQNPLDGFIKIIKEQISVNPSKQKNKSAKKKKPQVEQIQEFKEDRIDRLIQQLEFQNNTQMNAEQL